jgi:hypothetical protein
MPTYRTFVMTGLVSLGISGCDECENGFKIKKEYSTIFYNEAWHTLDKDTILDGAIRTETYTIKDARILTVRCFQASAPSQVSQYDIRYSIYVPLLVRIVPELEKAGPIEFIISIDGMFVARIPTKVVAQKDSLDLLATVEPTLIEEIDAAKKSIVVMPRQKDAPLDTLTEFGVARLSDYLVKVKQACGSLHKPTEPMNEKAPQETKKT